MTVVRCYQKCCLRGEDGICTKEQITLDTRGACLYREAEPRDFVHALQSVGLPDKPEANG